jgi:hypothetical protein
VRDFSGARSRRGRFPLDRPQSSSCDGATVIESAVETNIMHADDRATCRERVADGGGSHAHPEPTRNGRTPSIQRAEAIGRRGAVDGARPGGWTSIGARSHRNDAVDEDDDLGWRTFESVRARGNAWRPVHPHDWQPRDPTEEPRHLRAVHARPPLRRAVAIVDVLDELSPTFDDPQPLNDQCRWAAIRWAIELARPSCDGRQSLLESAAPAKPWAAALFALVDCQQWYAIAVDDDAFRPCPAWPRWRTLALRRAAWGFGAGLPGVEDIATAVAAWSAVAGFDSAWVAPAARSPSQDLKAACEERRHTLEVTRCA